MKNLLPNRDLLARLIGFDSTSKNSNRPIADFICDYLDFPGVKIERQPSPDSEKLNLIVRVGPPEHSEGGGLVLSGHMDTVPAEEPEWETDPYTLSESAEHYYGRGVCDMKGFLALAMNAAASASDKDLRNPLVLVFTYDEEVGILGSRHLAQAYEGCDELPTATIIGEPTSLKVVRMHKGFLGFKVVLFGKSAHSGYPHLGRNAIEPAGSLIHALKEFRSKLESETPRNAEFFPEVPFAALNVGTIHGGSAANIIPDRCELACSLRILPGTEVQPMIERVRQVVERAPTDCELEFVVTNESPPLLLEEESKIYETLARQVGQTDTRSASYATDGGWLQTLGLECAVFGPGNIEAAHRPNEFLPLGEFAKCEEILGLTIDEFCRHT